MWLSYLIKFLFLLLLSLKKPKIQSKRYHGSQWDVYLFLISRLRLELGIVRWRSSKVFRAEWEWTVSKMGRKEVHLHPNQEEACVSLRTQLYFAWTSVLSLVVSAQKLRLSGAVGTSGGLRPSSWDAGLAGETFFLFNQWSQINGRLPQELWEWTIYITRKIKI